MKHLEPESDDPFVRKNSRSNLAIVILGIITALSILIASGAVWYAWQKKVDQVEAGQITAEQITRICDEDPVFRRENPGLCGNAEEVAKDDPEIQQNEIDDPDPNDPDPNDPDPFDDSDPDNPEQQQPERQEDEIQSDEIQDADPNDPDPVDDPDPNDADPDDPDPNDPDPDDPDPAAPGTWNCPDDQYMVGFSRGPDGSITLNCRPMNNGGGPTVP